MNEQFELPYQRTSQTSHDAAISMRPHSESLRVRVLRAIEGALPVGITDQELSTFLKLDENTVRPRRVELVKAGLIESCGTRPTKSGRQANVWVATRGGGS